MTTIYNYFDNKSHLQKAMTAYFYCHGQCTLTHNDQYSDHTSHFSDTSNSNNATKVKQCQTLLYFVIFLWGDSRNIMIYTLDPCLYNNIQGCMLLYRYYKMNNDMHA